MQALPDACSTRQSPWSFPSPACPEQYISGRLHADSEHCHYVRLSLSLGLSFPFHLLLLKSPLSVIMDYGHLGGCPLQSPMPGSKVQIVIKTINTLVGRSQVYNARYR